MATPSPEPRSERRPSRLERSIYGWLDAPGVHRVKAIFGEGSDVESFTRETNRLKPAGVRILCFDSPPPRFVWLIVEGRWDPDLETRDAQMESVTSTLMHLVALAQKYRARIYFMKPRN